MPSKTQIYPSWNSNSLHLKIKSLVTSLLASFWDGLFFRGYVSLRECKLWWQQNRKAICIWPNARALFCGKLSYINLAIHFNMSNYIQRSLKQNNVSWLWWRTKRFKERKKKNTCTSIFGTTYWFCGFCREEIFHLPIIVGWKLLWKSYFKSVPSDGKQQQNPPKKKHHNVSVDRGHYITNPNHALCEVEIIEKLSYIFA